jgi:hypothetical protein
MSEVIIIGLDLAKNVFQAHGTTARRGRIGPSLLVHAILSLIASNFSSLGIAASTYPNL